MGVFVYILKNNNMNTGSVLFFVFTLLSIVCGQCTYTASNGCTYDLSGLTIAVNQPTSAFYTGMDTSNSTFYFNICGALNSELSTGSSTPPGVLQETLNTGNYSCGAYNNTSIGDYSGAAAEGSCPGVNLIYFDGTACINAGLTRQTTINIGCDSTVVNGLSVDSIVEPTTVRMKFKYFQMQHVVFLQLLLQQVHQLLVQQIKHLQVLQQVHQLLLLWQIKHLQVHLLPLVLMQLLV